jgi:uncharacterized membrane protein
MNKRESTAVLLAITVLLMFSAVQPLIPASSHPFSELGILGPNKTLGSYPTRTVVGTPLLLYALIGNHEGVASYYQLLIKLGNQTVEANNSTAANAPVIFTTSVILNQNESVILPLNITIQQVGTNLRLIFELWSFNETSSQFAYTGDWNQLVLTVTRS